MSPEDKKRIEQDAEEHAKWQLIDYGDFNESAETQIIEAYVAGAEDEFNRREAEVAELRAEIEDLKTRSFPKPGTPIPCNQ